MYIYLDESYNLKNKNKKQFISINGFSVLDERALFKKWKEYRAPFVGKRRIHAADSAFDSLRVKALKLFAKPDVTLTDILLEFADFVSNIFYREYQNGNDVFFEEIDFKLVQIKNPL